jgi:hypothetical protein
MMQSALVILYDSHLVVNLNEFYEDTPSLFPVSSKN